MDEHPTHWAWSQEISPMPKLVLLALADMAGAGSDQAWPSIEYLQEKTGMGRNTVMRAIQTLSNLKLVEVEKRSNRTNIYRICKSHSGTTVVPERDHGSPGEGPPQSQSGTQTYKEPTKNLPRTKREPAPEVELPLALNTPAFKEALKGFEEMRRTIKKPLTARAKTLVINKVEAWGHDVAVEALDRSTTSCWQGVFDPRESRGSQTIKGQPNKPRSTYDIRNQIEALDEEIRSVLRHRSEVAGGDHCWPTNTNYEEQYNELAKQRREANRELAGMRKPTTQPKPSIPALAALAESKRVGGEKAA